MRLIDADAVEVGFDELCQSPYFNDDVNAKYGAETLMDVCVRTDSHKPNTIDPETLPIVRQLREELDRVKAERDAMIQQKAWYTCRFDENTLTIFKHDKEALDDSQYVVLIKYTVNGCDVGYSKNGKDGPYSYVITTNEYGGICMAEEIANAIFEAMT